MNSRSSSRLWAAVRPSVSASFRLRPQSARPFSQTWLRRAEEPPKSASNDKPAAEAAEAAAAAEPATSSSTSISQPSDNASGLPADENVMAKLSSILSPGSDTTSSGATHNTTNTTRADTRGGGGGRSRGAQYHINRAMTMNVGQRGGAQDRGNKYPSTSSSSSNDDISILGNTQGEWDPSFGPAHEPFHFHVKSHKRNCHITVTKPNRGAIISMSTGNIGFRKAKRGTYDAAYQLAAYVVDKLHQGNWHRRIHQMEVVLKGFGQGREAASKVLMGNEGRMLRELITRVSDATVIKFGGTRSKRPRRLG